MYIAQRVLRVGKRDLMPGDPVPQDPYRDYRSLVEVGWIKEVPDPEPAPPTQSLEESVPPPSLKQPAIYECPECHATFTTDQGLRVHMRRRHDGKGA